MQGLTFATLLALVWKVATTLKYLTSRQWNGLITQVVVWASGIGVIALSSHATLTEKLAPWPGVTLGSLDGASIVIAGLLTGSAASVLYDAKKAVDNNDSAIEPKLLR